MADDMTTFRLLKVEAATENEKSVREEILQRLARVETQIVILLALGVSTLGSIIGLAIVTLGKHP